MLKLRNKKSTLKSINPPAPRATRLWNHPLRIHEALSFQLSAYQFLVFVLNPSSLQAFKPPVSSPPVLQSSSTRSSNVLLRILQYPSIRGIKISRSYRATPPSQKSSQAPCTGSSLPPWGLFSATPLAFCALGVHFQRPLSHSVLRSVKNTWESAPLRFLRHLAPHVGHLARLVGHLGANMSHKCSQDAQKCHLGANIAKKVLQPPFLAPQNTKKPMFSYSFCRFSAIQPMCQNTPKMLSTCSQNLPS